MKTDKKTIRKNFRASVFKRDGYRCVMCGLQADPSCPEELLDAHHITDRSEMPNGGYVETNGISLCKADNGCHWKAEAFHRNGIAETGFSPSDLYNKINSSSEKAIEDSNRSLR